MAAHNPQVAMLLQDYRSSPNPMLDLTIDLAKSRAGSAALIAALERICSWDLPSGIQAMAKEALDYHQSIVHS